METVQTHLNKISLSLHNAIQVIDGGSPTLPEEESDANVKGLRTVVGAERKAFQVKHIFLTRRGELMSMLT